VLGAAACFPISERSVAPSILVVVRYLYGQSSIVTNPGRTPSSLGFFARSRAFCGLRSDPRSPSSLVSFLWSSLGPSLALLASFFPSLAKLARPSSLHSDPRSPSSLARPRFTRTLARQARSPVLASLGPSLAKLASFFPTVSLLARSSKWSSFGPSLAKLARLSGLHSDPRSLCSRAFSPQFLCSRAFSPQFLCSRVLSRRLRGREEAIASLLVLPPINSEEAIASFAFF
jgi:hypothetical protein